MQLLPQPIDEDQYWRDVYKQDLPVWEPALVEIAASHHLPTEVWTRIALGRNIVFSTPTIIIKLGPPCWKGEMEYEVAALRFVNGKLPIATPAVLATGTIDHWDYIIQTRLPGTPLWELWPQLSLDVKVDLAYQHGQIMRAIHAIPLENTPSEVQFNWQEMITEQHKDCRTEMAQAGVDPELMAQVDTYLDTTDWSADAGPDVLLHGDLNHLNFMVSPHNDRWQLSGVVDWGDAKVGPSSHEWISPGVWMYKGQSEMLAQWYHGYQLAQEKRTEEFEHIVMTRALLYYAGSLPKILERVEGATACQDWQSIAQAFWHLSHRDLQVDSAEEQKGGILGK